MPDVGTTFDGKFSSDSRADPLPTGQEPSFYRRTDGDVQLIVGVSRSQPEAPAALYGRHAGSVFALARRLLVDRHLAEDVVQDVFVGLWRDPARFDPERGSLRSFLLARTHGRASISSSPRVHAAPANSAVPSGVAGARRTSRRQSSVGGWPNDSGGPWKGCRGCRAAVDLAYFSGRTYREVAAILHPPEGTVKSRIRYGLRKLRGALGEAAITSP